MTSSSSTAAQELNSSPKHQTKITTSVKDYFGFALASDYTSDELPLPQFVLPHVLGSMQVLLNSPQEADTRLCTISEKCGLLEVETAALFLARFILPVMEKHGQTQVQVEIGVHAIIMQQ